MGTSHHTLSEATYRCECVQNTGEVRRARARMRSITTSIPCMYLPGEVSLAGLYVMSSASTSTCIVPCFKGSVKNDADSNSVHVCHNVLAVSWAGVSCRL